MACRDAPAELIEAVSSGLLQPDMSLRSAVVVAIAEDRRNDRGWPEVMFAALVTTSDNPNGVPAVWAAAATGGPIFAVDGAAREVSDWTSAVRVDSRAHQIKNMLGGYPETAEARRCAGRQPERP